MIWDIFHFGAYGGASVLYCMSLCQIWSTGILFLTILSITLIIVSDKVLGLAHDCVRRRLWEEGIWLNDCSAG
jgi:hypothetical protein